MLQNWENIGGHVAYISAPQRLKRNSADRSLVGRGHPKETGVRNGVCNVVSSLLARAFLRTPTRGL